MSTEPPLVSAVIIFLDEERYLAEAIASVEAQTYPRWELLLVDDGSIDGSTDIARRAAETQPDRIRYLEHPGHANRGMSASRNLGIATARGRYVGSLDGDDTWLPDKLEHQVALLERNPRAAMAIAPLLRWRTWSGEPDAADLEDLMGVGRRKYGRHPHAGRVVDPPALARLMLADDYFIPGGALIRRDLLLAVGGYEEAFPGMYEDAVAMLKIAVRHPVLVDDRIGYLYRMHPDSCTNRTSSSGEIDRARAHYLRWVGDHLREHELGSPGLQRDLRRALRSTHRRRHRRYRALGATRAVGRRLLPRPVRDGLRRRWRQRTRPTVARP